MVPTTLSRRICRVWGEAHPRRKYKGQIDLLPNFIAAIIRTAAIFPVQWHSIVTAIGESNSVSLSDLIQTVPPDYEPTVRNSLSKLLVDNAVDLIMELYTDDLASMNTDVNAIIPSLRTIKILLELCGDNESFNLQHFITVTIQHNWDAEPAPIDAAATTMLLESIQTAINNPIWDASDDQLTDEEESSEDDIVIQGPRPARNRQPASDDEEEPEIIPHNVRNELNVVKSSQDRKDEAIIDVLLKISKNFDDQATRPDPVNDRLDYWSKLSKDHPHEAHAIFVWSELGRVSKHQNATLAWTNMVTKDRLGAISSDAKDQQNAIMQMDGVDLTTTGATINIAKLFLAELKCYGWWRAEKCNLADWLSIAIRRNKVFNWSTTKQCIKLVLTSILANANISNDSSNIALVKGPDSGSGHSGGHFGKKKFTSKPETTPEEKNTAVNQHNPPKTKDASKKPKGKKEGNRRLHVNLSKSTNINDEEDTDDQPKISKLMEVAVNLSADGSKQKKYNMIFDTAASISIIPRTVVNELKAPIIKSNKKYELEDFGGKVTTSDELVKIYVDNFQGKDPVQVVFVVSDGNHILFNTAVAKSLNIFITFDHKNHFGDWYNFTIGSLRHNTGVDEVTEEVSKPTAQISTLLSKNKNVSGKCTLKNCQYSLQRAPDGSSICGKAKTRKYSVNKKFRSLLDDHIQSLITNGFLKVLPKTHSGFEFSWTQRVQPDKVRFCVDCVPLNNHITIGDPTFPTITKIHQKLARGGYKYFSQLDIKNAYHTIPFATGTDDNLWCRWGDKRVAWTRLPFGLKDAPNHFNQVMVNIFGDMENVIVYFDNLLVATHTEDHNSEVTCEVLKRLNQYNIPVNPDKCTFITKSVRFLGTILSGEGLVIDPNRSAAIEAYPVPTTVKQLQQFLGTVNYCRSFLFGLAEHVDILQKITHEQPAKKPFTPDVQAEVNAKVYVVKDGMKKAIRLNNESLDDNADYVVYTDASDIGIAGAVGFIQDGEFKPIGLHSRSLKKVERGYSTPRKELLAVVETLCKYEHVLKPRSFTVFTDNESLTSGKGVKTEHGRAEFNWWSWLSEFDFRWVHIDGNSNVLADTLSRVFLSVDSTGNTKDIEALVSLHNENHLSAEFMQEYLDSVDVKWRGRDASIKAICKSCAICNLFNSSKRKYFAPQNVIANMPMFHLQMDMAGPLKHPKGDLGMVLIVVDIFSSFCWLFPIESKSSSNVIKALQRIVADHGRPHILQCDNAKEFISSNTMEWLKSNDIKLNNSSQYNPRANGKVERHVGIFKQLLKKMLICNTNEDNPSIDDLCFTIQNIVNSRTLSSVKVSPFNLLTGRVNNNPSRNEVHFVNVEPWLHRINTFANHWHTFINDWHARKAYKQNLKFTDSHKIVDDIPIGSLVFFKNNLQKAWFEEPWLGPAYISKIDEFKSVYLTACDEPPDRLLNQSFPLDQLKIIEEAEPFSDDLNPAKAVAMIAARVAADNTRDIMFKFNDPSHKKGVWINESILPDHLVEEFFNAVDETETAAVNWCHYVPVDGV